MNDICKNCETKLEIIQKSFIELTFNSSTFSYLVTEKNKNMNFIIKEKNDINPQLSHALIIWAYGNKEIKTYLNESNSIKHSKYNAYIINILDSYDDYKEYYFSINGTIGDILDIGFIFLNSYKWCKNCREEDMILYKIFLKQNILNYICFPFTYNNYENQYIQYIDDININAKVTQDKGNNQNCVQIPEDIDELFFSYHYLGRTHENNFNIFSLQIRNNYYQKIDEKTIIGFLPMRLEENFNSLTYYIQNLDPNKYKLNAYIGICKDFPFCLSSKDIIKTKILVPYMDSYSYTFNINDINKITSPIEKSKQILFVEFVKGYMNYDIYRNCIISVMLYTDKTTIRDITLYKTYKYIKKNNIDKINLNLKNYYYAGFNHRIHFENIYGNISIDINNKKNNYISYKNIFAFDFNSLEDLININISPKKDSIYSINLNYYLHYSNYYKMKAGGNYIFNVKKNQEIELLFEINRIYDRMVPSDEYIKYCIFTAFYPINCDIEIKNTNFKIFGNKSSENNKFYQTIGMNEFYNDIYYPIKPNNIIDSDSCLIYVSTYNLNSTTIDSSDSSIILKENNPQYFIFNNEFKEMNFSYYFIDMNQDIEINISLSEEVNLLMTMLINNKNQKDYKIISNETIININNKEIKNIIYENQICQIFFKIILFNQSEYTTLKIDIKSVENDINNIQSNNVKYIILYLIIIFSVIIICTSLVLLKKNKNGKNNLEKHIELLEMQ